MGFFFHYFSYFPLEEECPYTGPTRKFVTLTVMCMKKTDAKLSCLERNRLNQQRLIELSPPCVVATLSKRDHLKYLEIVFIVVVVVV